MITTMPLKEHSAPYIQPDNINGKMFDGGLNDFKIKATVNVYLVAGGKIKTPFTSMDDMAKVLNGTYDYTDMDEKVTTSMGTIEDSHYSSATVKDIEGVQSKREEVDGMVAIPTLYTGAFQAMKLKYTYVKVENIRQYVMEI